MQKSGVAEKRKVAEMALGKANNKFSADFFKLACEARAETNVFVSPYNVFSALSMLLVGLGGSSRRQLHKVLALGDSESSTLKQDLHNLIVAVRSKSSGAIVQTATSAWLHKSLSVLPSYADDLKQVFESENTIVDYSNPQQAVDTINSWVEKNTDSLIKELLSTLAVTPLTRLVLVSAIYFKGKWQTPFKPERTKEDMFTLIDGKTQQRVQMMSQTESFALGSVGSHVDGLVLPYESEDMSMIILLPKGDSSKIDSIAADAELLETAAAQASSWKKTKVFVKLPRFKMEFAMDAVKTMKQLGATDLFDASALDLSNMLQDGRNHNMCVTAIIHKAVISVDEEGTVAAAATAITKTKRGRPAPSPEFFVDRPFIFLICRGSSVIFAGKCLKIQQ